MVSTPERNLQQVRERVARACAAAGRPARAVTLVAVSKLHPAGAVRAVAAAGQAEFGENYVQEAADKMGQLSELRDALKWHLIGPLQSNKTRQAAALFDWVHTVDRLKLAERLAAQRPDDLLPLQVCLQVNIDAEPSKAGVAPQEAAALARAVARLPRLALRGLMAIPAPAQGLEAQRRPHRKLRELLGALNAQGLALDTLSIGMSDDLEAAVLEGATIVRVGTAIFGARGE